MTEYLARLSEEIILSTDCIGDVPGKITKMATESKDFIVPVILAFV
jgi:hypothetical protein